jgi:ferredoxin-thioredoxin reductase catalytic chain
MEEKVAKLYAKLKQEAQAGGYKLNPDEDFIDGLLRGLITNQERYGYMACPCRLASGQKGADIDIICPCYYRDQDLTEFGVCYCALYASGKIASGEEEPGSIPDRRPPDTPSKPPAAAAVRTTASLTYPVYRCQVCGYLCAREHPPESCPICKVPADRFERFL